jgi:hypothetical protein
MIVKHAALQKSMCMVVVGYQIEIVIEMWCYLDRVNLLA